jgi:hypothetical protein
MRLPLSQARLQDLQVRLRHIDVQAIRGWVGDNPAVAAGIGVPTLVFLAAVFFLVNSYFAETSKQVEIQDQFNRLAGITAGAQSRADEIEAEFEAIQDGLPPPDLKETDVFRALREVATEFGIDIASVNIALKSDTASRQVGSTRYRVLTLTMGIGGQFDDVWTFIQALDNGQGPYPTLILDKLSFTQGATSTATLDFSIYTLPVN